MSKKTDDLEFPGLGDFDMTKMLAEAEEHKELILTMADAIVRIEVLIMKLCTKLDVKC